MMSAKTGLFIAIIAGVSLMACAGQAVSDLGSGNAMPAKTIKQVLEQHTNELISIPGVVGTAEGLCGRSPCVKVYVMKKTPDLEQKIPDTLDGYPVTIEETGKIRALPER
jgi:hypothetical protein